MTYFSINDNSSLCFGFNQVSGLPICGTGLFGLAFSVWPIRSACFGLAVSVWVHFGHKISVHEQPFTFVYFNDYTGR